jgi:hypothetical protein
MNEKNNFLANWKGKLVMYAHGYEVKGMPYRYGSCFK